MRVPFRTVAWSEDGRAIRIIDQRALPAREEYLTLHNSEEVAAAINNMSVRGAPAIGIVAAMAVALDPSEESFSRLAATRPTAVNDSDEGRASNRRIEIVLYPKDLGAIVSQMPQ